MKLKTLLIASLALAPLAAFAQSTNTIKEVNAYARATPPNASNSAVFTEIVNSGNKDRYIVSAHTTVAKKTELHNVFKNGDTLKMRQIEQIKVPANGKVTLKPGSLHIMLLDLKKPLVPGEKVSVTLTFANGDTQTFIAPIEKVAAGMKMAHKHH
ncbi:copper chaperone PCu(A)C [Vibrio sp. S4M6]|uniref:copper chaperone PCu(A)C n=1 Tax=Vibrio sinus TaxID=2946865 RepID=UPI00202A771E|nr:copper chaperone PCu(A)C [Vibrio sinus]MCL9781767.1 copper chaperone PCu(A)C [Vibrio sinus]